MFESTSGIMLPDEDGTILDKLHQDVIDIQRINQLLYDQGIIWPITHFSYGYFHKAHIDFSKYNITNPALNLVWIGNK